MSHFNVSLIVWAKSQDSVHEPQFLKIREKRAEADRTKVLLLTSQAPYRVATPAHQPCKRRQALLFSVEGRNAVGLNSQSAMSTTSKCRPKGWATWRHRNWFSWYRIAPVSGIPIISIETQSYLEMARQMGNGMTGELLCFAGLSLKRVFSFPSPS